MKKAILLFCLLFPLAYAVTPSNPGDLNNDGAVNIQDVYIVSGCLGQSATTCQGGKADPNNDNVVNIFDFISVSQRWGSSYVSQQPTLFFNENFENNQLLSRGWYDSPNGLLSTTEFVPGSAASMEYRFLPSATTPTQGKTARHLFTATDQVYLSFWIKYSSNWVGSQVTYHPHQFYFVNDLDNQYVGPSITRSTFYIEENGGNPLVGQQDALNIDQTKRNVNLIGVSENRATAGCNGNPNDGAAYQCYAYNTSFYTNAKTWKSSTQWFSNTAGPTFKGNWHFIETYIKLNSIQNGVGASDGIIQYWYDGQPVINVQNALFRTGTNANMKLNQFIIAPYIGVGSPVQQSFWLDNLTVMTARPGAYTPPSAQCGNGAIESGEQCDGTNLNGATCVSRGFSAGILTCHATTCQYVTSACTNADTTNPTVALTAPTNGAILSGTTIITAIATDNVGVQSVQFTVDGSNYGSPDTTSPYSISWDTTSATNAQHTISAVATDTSGNSATAASITVTVNNAPAQTCGNGIIEGTELCDGTALGSNTCTTQGFTGGTLTCNAGTCTLNTAQCTSNPPSTSNPNEPAGMLPYADLTMAGATSGWTALGNVTYVDGNTYTPTSSIGATINPPGAGPMSPASIWQIKMPYHMTSGRGSGSGTATGPQAKTIYFSGWFQVSSNWYGENTQPPGTGVIKMIMPEVQSTTWSAVANRIVISAAHGSGNNALSARVAWQQIVTVAGSTGISTSYYGPKSGTGSIQRGQWHHIEFVTVANSPGVADGRFQMWIDGKETHNIQGIQYDPSADIKWQRVNLNSVYGGPTNVNATPDDQYIWWDHAYISYSTSQK